MQKTENNCVDVVNFLSVSFNKAVQNKCYSVNVKRVFHGARNPNRALQEHDDVGQEIISFNHVDSAVTELHVLYYTATRVLSNATQTRGIKTVNTRKHRLYCSGCIYCYKT